MLQDLLEGVTFHRVYFAHSMVLNIAKYKKAILNMAFAQIVASVVAVTCLL